MKQKIILLSHRDGYSERRITRELGINRETVRRYLAEYSKAREKLTDSADLDEVLIEDLVKIPCYNSSNRDKKKFTKEISQEVDRLLKANEEKRSRGHYARYFEAGARLTWQQRLALAYPLTRYRVVDETLVPTGLTIQRINPSMDFYGMEYALSFQNIKRGTSRYVGTRFGQAVNHF